MRRSRGRQSVDTQPGLAPESTSPVTGSTRHAAGFNLVELMVVILIISVLLGIGIPSFRYVTNSNRVATQVNTLLGDMQFARSEAIKRGATVSVCAANNPTAVAAACSGSNAWQQGWVVFVDVNNSGKIDSAADTVLRAQGKFPNAGDSFIADNAVNFVSFNREGFAAGLPPTLNGFVTITLHTTPVATYWTRCLQINIVGNMTTQQPASGSACQ